MKSVLRKKHNELFTEGKLKAAIKRHKITVLGKNTIHLLNHTLQSTHPVPRDDPKDLIELGKTYQ